MAAEFARKHANTVVTGLASAAPLLLASQHSGGGAGMETVGLAGLAVGAKFLESSGPLSQNRNLHKEIVDLEREQHKEAQHLQKQQHDAEQKLQRTHLKYLDSLRKMNQVRVDQRRGQSQEQINLQEAGTH